MSNSRSFPTRKTIVLVGALLVSASAYAQNTMQPGSMSGSAMSDSMAGSSMDPMALMVPAASADPTADTSSSFAQEWQTAEEALRLSAEQREKLAITLKAASMKISENWGAIENYRKLAANSSGDTQVRYKKRIEIAFGERDLIITEAESELLSFLNENQTNIVLTAAFHGVSPNHSGSMTSMPMDGMSGMETMDDVEMRIGELAEKLNADFRAVSIDRIIDALSSADKSSH